MISEICTCQDTRMGHFVNAKQERSGGGRVCFHSCQDRPGIVTIQRCLTCSNVCFGTGPPAPNNIRVAASRARSVRSRAQMRCNSRLDLLGQFSLRPTAVTGRTSVKTGNLVTKLRDNRTERQDKISQKRKRNCHCLFGYS